MQNIPPASQDLLLDHSLLIRPHHICIGAVSPIHQGYVQKQSAVTARRVIKWVLFGQFVGSISKKFLQTFL